MPSSWCEAAGGGDWSVAQAKQAFGGSAAHLAAALAGVDSRQKGYYKETRVKSQLQNLGRWQAAQQPQYGPLPEGKKARSSRAISPEQQKKLNDTVREQMRKGRTLGHLSIKGKILVNDSDPERRPRRIEKAINWRMVDRLGAIACASKDGEKRAWAAFSVWYNLGEPGLSMKPGGPVDIVIS